MNKGLLFTCDDIEPSVILFNYVFRSYVTIHFFAFVVLPQCLASRGLFISMSNRVIS